MEQLGPYVLEARIARGGMGEIYRASLVRSAGFQRTVALKRILPHLSDDATFIRMFETEARLTALLNHPNIVHMYDFGRDDGTVWLAMEFVNGIDLRRLHDACTADGEPLPIGLALHIVEQCARGLHYAHTLIGTNGPLQIVHRDISPQNIMVSIQGETKLTDFGLAKALAADPGSMSGMMKGKLGYMAPEQVQGAKITPKTDIFGLGAVLYELVSGRRVYPVSDGLAAIVARATHAEIEPLTEADAPRDIRDIVARCLRRAPEERFSSASELADALDGVLSTHAMDAGRQALGRLVHTYRIPSNEPHVMATQIPAATAVAERPANAVQAPVPVDISERGAASSNTHTATFVHAETAIGAPVFTTNDSQLDAVAGSAAGQLRHAGLGRSVALPSWPIMVIILLSLIVGAAYVFTDSALDRPAKLQESGKLESRTIARSAVPLPAVIPRSAEGMSLRRNRRMLTGAQSLVLRTSAGEVSVTVSGVDTATCYAWSELRQQQRLLECGTTVRLPVGPWRILAKSNRGDRTKDIVVTNGTSVQRVDFRWAPEPVTCELRVSSNPPGAKVSVDGIVLESFTPLSTVLTAGTHSVLLEKRGRKLAEHRLDCTSGPLRLDAMLERLEYVVVVGNHRKRLKPGTSKRWSIRRSDGGRATLRVRVNSAGMGVAVLDASPYVDVTINGVSKGVTPVRSIRMSLGKRTTVALSRDGMKVGQVSVLVQELAGN